MANDVKESQEKEIDKEEKKRLKKEEKLRKKEAKKSKKGNKPFRLIFKVILLIIILFIISFIIVKNDLFGMGDSFLGDFLKEVPIVNSFLPPELEGSESLGRDELLIENAKLEKEVEALKTKNEVLEKQRENLELEIDRLKLFETEYLEFKTAKEAFDLEVASGDPVQYVNYYSSIYPENAERIYKEIVGEVYNQEEVARYIARFEALDASTCAQILEELIFTDLNLVVAIIDEMVVDKSAEVLENMDSVNASMVMKRLTPIE